LDVIITAFTQVCIMFAIMLVGFVLAKIGKITHDGRKQISGIILTVVCPALVFTAFQADKTPEYMVGLLWAFVLATVSILFGIFFAKIAVSKKKSNFSLDRFGVIYSNCAFMGIPLINGIFGAEGVFYVTAYITMFNLFVWSHGVMLMKDEMSVKGLLNAIKSPTIIAVFVGLICYFADIKIPKIPSEALNYIASMNTPLAMLVAGATMADSKLTEAVRKPSVLYDCFLKLLVLPVIVMFIFKIFPITSEVVYTTIIIATACPTATVLTLFALNFDKNATYGAEIFAVSTLLSGITIPLIVVLSKMIYMI